MDDSWLVFEEEVEIGNGGRYSPVVLCFPLLLVSISSNDVVLYDM